jgi:hypothetical protein
MGYFCVILLSMPNKLIKRLNQYTHTEIGVCLQCGKMYKLPQVIFPDGVALTSMAHPPGLIDDLADAIRSGKLRLGDEAPPYS